VAAPSTAEGAGAPLLSIIIPVLDEASGIGACLQPLQPLRDRAQILVVDGGSSDDTVALAAPLCDQVLQAPRGRASQMNAGARRATGRFLLFLHSDTLLPPPAQWLEQLSADAPSWGFFPVRLSGADWRLRVVAWFMNRRSALTKIATGDQGLLVEASAWNRLGGFAALPLMEDIEACRRLRRQARPWIAGQPVVTSSRRWESHGLTRTVLVMWWLRFAYWLGVSPERLASYYYGR
jgi:rSAM/selenodomain-associated transferase 2